MSESLYWCEGCSAFVPWDTDRIWLTDSLRQCPCCESGCVNRVDPRMLTSARSETARILVGALLDWCCTFGADLKPPGVDTYGEDMRAAKERVRKILEIGKWGAGDYPHMNRVTQICRQIHKDTQFLSGLTTNHPLYKELVGLGLEVVPALLHHLDCFEAPWDGLAIWEPLSALREITGENVIPEKDLGRLGLIIGHWLDWGERQNIYERVQWDG